MSDEKQQEAREQGTSRPCKNSIPAELSSEASSALGDAYELLCLAFRLPNAVLFDGMKDGRLLDSVRSIADDLGLDDGGECMLFVAERLEEARCLQGDALGSLRVAYTNLFTHPVAPRVMCHESLFLYFEADPKAPIGNAPRLFVNHAALSIERIMRESGLHRSEVQILTALSIVALAIRFASVGVSILPLAAGIIVGPVLFCALDYAGKKKQYEWMPLALCACAIVGVVIARYGFYLGYVI